MNMGVKLEMWNMFLLSDSTQDHMFQFPCFSQGRNELLSVLRRKKYKEMMMSCLEKKHLRFSPLDMRFHIRDLIGSGQLKTVETPSGLIVRVAKD